MSPKQTFDFSTDDWAKKLEQQAEATKEYRYKLYERVDLKNRKHILDVGCGTGAITKDIASLTSGKVIGIDIDIEKLEHAKKLLENTPNITLKSADATKLPFDDESFDLVVFNIVLIHVRDQQKAMDEMARVTEKNGVVLATLEPDYASIIEYPENPFTKLWMNTVKDLGADLHTGRKLKVLFNRAGLKTEFGIDIEANFILNKDDKCQLERFIEQFWLNEKIFKNHGWSSDDIEKYKRKHINLIKKGLYFKFAPAFYAIGRKTRTIDAKI